MTGTLLVYQSSLCEGNDSRTITRISHHCVRSDDWFTITEWISIVFGEMTGAQLLHQLSVCSIDDWLTITEALLLHESALHTK